MELAKFKEIRRHLHKHPEVSWKEFETKKYVKSFLESCKPTKIIELAKTGLLALFDSEKEGPVVLLRAELDALPIQETNDIPYRSQRDHVGHQCGHDGHATMLMGVADYLKDNRPPIGKVYLIFQPAEETGEGAREVLDDPAWEDVKPDICFALHNIPRKKKGLIIVREGVFSHSVKSLIVQLIGKTAHAGEPENGINPAYGMSDLIHRFDEIENERDDWVVTPIHINLGEKAYGTSAGEGELHYTIRARKVASLDELSEKMIKAVKEVTDKRNLDFTLSWLQEFYTTRNQKDAVRRIIKAAEALGYEWVEKKEPFKWGEDFGLFTQHYMGAMFGLGSGEKTAALHNPDYNFPDDIGKYGINMFTRILEDIWDDGTNLNH